MKFEKILRSGRVVFERDVVVCDIGISGGVIAGIGDLGDTAESEIDARSLTIFPGLVDPHVHFREPGPSAEEDFETGTRAAAAGGVTTILEQPVDTPPTVTRELFEEKLKLVRPKSYVDFGLWGGLVPGNLDELVGLAEAGACAYKCFVCSSDPVYPMVDDGVLLEAMHIIASTGRILAIHCENQAIISTSMARLNQTAQVTPLDHTRSRPEIAEAESISRVIHLARETGVRLHILHLSAAGGVDLVQAARREGYPVTVETCPHYLVLTEDALTDCGPYAKCNPPLRNKANQDLLWLACQNGNIDCVVSDHSPYTTADKQKGMADIRLAAPGINGLELGFSLVLDSLSRQPRLTLPQLSGLMSTNPAKIFGLYPRKGQIAVGADADMVMVDLAGQFKVSASRLETKNKWTPFDGWNLKGRVVRTLVRGQTVYLEGEFPAGPGYGQFLNGNIGLNQ